MYRFLDGFQRDIPLFSEQRNTTLPELAASKPSHFACFRVAETPLGYVRVEAFLRLPLEHLFWNAFPRLPHHGYFITKQFPRQWKSEIGRFWNTFGPAPTPIW